MLKSVGLVHPLRERHPKIIPVQFRGDIEERVKAVLKEVEDAHGGNTVHRRDALSAGAW